MEVICVHSPEGKQDPLMTNTATAHLMSYLAKETCIKELTIFSDGASSTYHARYVHPRSYTYYPIAHVKVHLDFD